MTETPTQSLTEAIANWHITAEPPTDRNPTGLVYTDGDTRVWVDRSGLFKSNYPSARIADMATMQAAWFGWLVEREREYRSELT